MERGKREQKKQLKETQALQKGKPPIKNLPRTTDVAGGAEKALQQTNHKKGSMATQTLIEMKRGTGANKGEVMPKPPADHWRGGGRHEEMKIRNERWHHLQPREGKKRSAEKEQNITQKMK